MPDVVAGSFLQLAFLFIVSQDSSVCGTKLHVLHSNLNCLGSRLARFFSSHVRLAMLEPRPEMGGLQCAQSGCERSSSSLDSVARKKTRKISSRGFLEALDFVTSFLIKLKR